MITRRVRSGSEAALVMLGSGLIALIYTVPAPLLFQIGREYGPWIAQGMGNLPSLGIIIAGPLSGMVSRRLPARTILIASLLAYCVLGPMGAFVHEAYLLLITRFALGLAAALAVSTTIAILSSRYTGASRPRMIGIAGGLAGFLGLVSLFLSGQIASRYSWRASFWMYLFGAVLLILAAFGGDGATARQPKLSTPRVGAVDLVQRNLRILIAVTLLFCASFSTGLQLSFKLGEHGILSPTAQSYVILGSSLFNAVGSFAYGYIASLFGDAMVTLLLLALMTAGALTIGGGATAAVIGLGGSLMGLGGGMVGPNLLSKSLLRVSPDERPGVTGLFYSSIFIGEFLNPMLMQPLRSSLGTDGAFLTLGGLLGVATLTVFARRMMATR